MAPVDTFGPHPVMGSQMHVFGGCCEDPAGQLEGTRARENIDEVEINALIPAFVSVSS